MCVVSLGAAFNQKHKKDVGKYCIFQLLSPVTFEAIMKILNVWPKLLTEIPLAVHCMSPPAVLQCALNDIQQMMLKRHQDQEIFIPSKRPHDCKLLTSLINILGF